MASTAEILDAVISGDVDTLVALLMAMTEREFDALIEAVE